MHWQTLVDEWGATSTMYARTPAWMTLIAKSSTYTNKTANSMMHVLTPFDSGSAPKRPRKPPMISLAQARTMRDTMVAAAPPMMKGLRFPQRRRQLSLLRPT